MEAPPMPKTPKAGGGVTWTKAGAVMLIGWTIALVGIGVYNQMQEE